MHTDKLHKILDAADGVWGVVVKHIGQPVAFEYNADEAFRAASVGKVPVALYLMHLIETGAAQLDQSFTVTKEYYQDGSGLLQYLTPGLQLPLKDLIALMLIESDNTAAEVLIKNFDAIEINKYTESLGFARTHLGIKQNDYDFGETAPREMATMLEGIYDARYVNKAHSDLLLGLMKKCKNQLGIRRYLEGIEVANKSGAGDHVRNDIGIVFTKQPYSIVVLSKDLPVVSFKPDNPAVLTIAQLSAEVYSQLG